MSEMQETVQVLAITAQTGTQLISYGMRFLGKSVLFVAKLLNTLYLAKWKGKTSFNHFRAIKGEDMQFMCIATEDKTKLRQIYKQMKNHGILVGKLPDLCKNDGMTQFVMSPTDMKKMEAFLINHGKGKNRDIKIEPITAVTYGKTGYKEDGKTPTEELKELEESAKNSIKKTAIEKKETLLLENPPERKLIEDKLRSFQQLETIKEMQRPEFVKIPVSQDAQLIRHSRGSAFALPDSPFAVWVPNANIEKKEGGFQLYLDTKKSYLLIDKLTHELSSADGLKVFQEFNKPSYKMVKSDLMENVARQLRSDTKISVSQSAQLFQHEKTAAFALPGSPYAVLVPTSGFEQTKDGYHIYFNKNQSYVLIDKKTRQLTSRSGLELSKEFADIAYQVKMDEAKKGMGMPQRDAAKITVSRDAKIFQHEKTAAFALPDSPYNVLIPTTGFEQTKDGYHIYFNKNQSYVLLDKKTKQLTSRSGLELSKELTKPRPQVKINEGRIDSSISQLDAVKITVNQDAQLFQHTKTAAFALPGSSYAVLVPNAKIEKSGNDCNLYLDKTKGYVLIHKKDHTLSSASGAKLAEEFNRPSYQETTSRFSNLYQNLKKKADNMRQTLKAAKLRR